MIVFALSVLFCVSATDCRWWSEGVWVNEKSCHSMGKDYLAADPKVRRYKCVATVKDEQ